MNQSNLDVSSFGVKEHQIRGYYPSRVDLLPYCIYDRTYVGAERRYHLPPVFF